MKSILRIIVVSVVVGAIVGAALAAWQAVPWNVAVTETNDSEDHPSADLDSAHAIAKFEETTFHFGTMEHGTAMAHAFRVNNLGSSPLHVEVGSTTCKCTVGDLTTNQIAPGAEADVNLMWEAKSSPGPFRHGATLFTNDPAQSRIELTVEGTVVESTTLEPSQLFFGNVHAGETKEAEIVLMAFMQEEVHILTHHLGDEQLAEQIDVEIVPCAESELPNPEARSGIRVIATLRAGRTLGPLHDWLTLEAEFIRLAEESTAGKIDAGKKIQDNAIRKFNIPIVANVVGDISIFGSGWIAKRGLLKMGMIKSGEGKSSRLNLVVRGEHALTAELKIVKVMPEELRATLGERRVMGDQLVHVPLSIEVPIGTRPMTRRGKAFDEVSEIVISTNHPETPEIKFQVQFAVHP